MSLCEILATLFVIAFVAVWFALVWMNMKRK